jgi:hypothetical protein
MIRHGRWIGCLMDESFYPHPSQRFRLNQQIGQLSRVGKFSEAVSKALKLLELREKVLGPGTPKHRG